MLAQVESKPAIAHACQELFVPAEFKVFHGGRASSKSWSVARALLIIAFGSKKRILCAREFQSSIKESSKHLLETQIEIFGWSPWFTITKSEIVCNITGSQFIFYGLIRDPQTIKSLEGIDLCWVEEANNISQESLDYLIPTIRADDSEIWFTFNRRQTTDPIDKMFLSEDTPQRPNTIIRQVNYWDNPWFTKKSRSNMEYDKQHDYEAYLHIWEGQPVSHSDSLVFSGKWRIDGHIEPGPDETLYYGADWGFAQDPTTLLRCWVDHGKREIYVDHEHYQVKLEIDDTPAAWEAVPGSQKWEIRADSARPETISYMNRHGYRVRPAKKGPGSLEEGVNFLRSYTIVVHSRCKRLISELGLYSYKIDKHTGDVLPLLVDKHNHCIDSLRYALEKFAFAIKQVGVW